MKILLLTKRQYTNKDLLDDRFGRLWVLPHAWAQGGHEVLGLCLSYAHKREASLDVTMDDGAGSLSWLSRNAGPVRATGLWRFYRMARQVAASFQPDVVLASSDMIYVVVGRRIAAGCGAAFVADLYDNYEIFASAAIPGLRRLYRRALDRADLVACVSPPLQRQVQDDVGRAGPTIVVENAVDRAVFRPRDRIAARTRLELPQDARIVGTAGALTASRGIDCVFEAYTALAADDPNLHLALAGPRDVAIPDHPRVHDFGMLDWEAVPHLLSALDLGVVCNKDTAFARYCFPQKAYEMLACGVNVVAADVGVMSEMFAHAPGNLFAPGDAASLAAAVRHGLTAPPVNVGAIPTWDELAARLEHAMSGQIGGI